MAKLIEIKDCGVCPHFESTGAYRCKALDRWIDDRYFPKIPEWCPLRDASIIDKYLMSDADGAPD